MPLPGIGRASKAARVQFSPPQSLMQPGLCPHHVSLVSVPHCAPASPGLLHPGLCLELSLGPTQLPGPHMLWRENMRTKGRAHGRTHLFPFLWVLCWVLPLFNPFPKASGFCISYPIQSFSQPRDLPFVFAILASTSAVHAHSRGISSFMVLHAQ